MNPGAEQDTRLAGFFLFAHPGAHMRHRPARLSRGGMVSRLIPFLALGALLADCQNAERSVAPGLDGPQFSLSATEGLKGRIVFHSTRAGTFDIFVMNADGSGVTQLTNTTDQDVDAFWSPNGQRIAFNRFDNTFSTLQIVVMNADGSGVTRLISDAFATAWSPDGKRIAFASNRRGGDEVFVMNADGSGVTQLTNNDFVRDLPTVWSPNGKQIAFQSTRDGDEEIFIMNADGTDQTQLTFNQGVFDAVPGWTAGRRDEATGGRCLSPPTGLKSWWPGDGDVGDLIGGNHGIGTFNVYVMTPRGAEQTQLTDAPGYSARPSWSHDGRRITFTACRPTDLSCEVYVMNADGSGQTKLTNDLTADYMSVWSPDDQRIAFVSERDGPPHIYVMNADGSNPTALTQGSAVDQLPTWSPDGARIAFQTNRDGNSEVYVINADGSNPTNLTRNLAAEEFPAWSPGGDKIAFKSDRDGNGEIYVMNVDGSHPTRLTNNPADEYYPAWSPTGSRIAFASNRDGNYEIYIMKPDGSAQQRVTNNPAWDADPAWATRTGADADEASFDDRVLAGQLLAFASARAKFGPAKVGEGFRFDGAGNAVFAPGAGIDNLQQLTIDAWVKHNSLTPGRIERYVTLGGEKAVLRYDGINGPAQLHFYMRIGGELQHIRVNNVLQVGVFHHVAGSYDGAFMRLYLDGFEVGNLEIRGAVDAGFGVEISSGGEPMDGVLDEIEIFDRALGASEVRAIFEADAAGDRKSVV